MNHLFTRIIALVIHAAANFVILSWLVDFDISGTWISFVGFIILLLLLLYLFIKHAISFYYFIKTKTK